MHRRTFLRGSASLALAGFASSVLAQPSRPSREIRITLPSPGSAGSAWQPLFKRFALDTGTGLNLDWVTADPGKMQIQLSAGSLDVGVFGAVGLATLVNRGSDIVLFGPALNNHGRWIVRGGSPFHAPRDLIGRTIATTAETSETYLQARIAASLNGVDLKKDVKVIHGSPTANLALFERGDVDAIVTLEPTATRLVGRGAREIARVADMWREATGASEDPFLVGLAASRKWFDANRETALELAGLFQRLGRAVQQEPGTLRQISSDLGLKETESEAIALLPERLAPAYSTRWGKEVFADIDKQVQVAAELGLIDRLPGRPLYVNA